MTIEDPTLASESDNRRRGFVTTAAGIQIGVAHVPKPRPLPVDAEKIQAALLDPLTSRPIPMRQRVLRAVWNWL